MRFGRRGKGEPAARRPRVIRKPSLAGWHRWGHALAEEEFELESLMPATGVVFGDGVESDFLEFNSWFACASAHCGSKSALVETNESHRRYRYLHDSVG